ncbi:MAG: DegQ family serine endoprotease [Pseudomonadales bacterium]|nr:DegQ family serine endoprotease [Pseudomonadales bacterium]
MSMKTIISNIRFIQSSLFILFFIPAVSMAHGPQFSELVERYSPAVVNISTITKQKPSRPYAQKSEQIPDILRHFFGDSNGQRYEQAPRREKNSLGSGFIISEDGFIVTNNHVVKDADKIIVRLSDRRELEATLIGADTRSDLAVLKIEANHLPTVKLGDSDRLRVGEWVLAIGSPFGFDYSASAGIVSAKRRSLPNESHENYVPFIQTDVAINPGNSGGPLFNLEGEVIGINSMIYSRSGGFMGLSFAIPVNVAKEVVKQLRNKGFVERGWLGVIIQEVNRDLAESFGLDKPQGALVAQVLPGSPAQAAGLETGDIITRFDNKEVVLSSDLPYLVGSMPVGKRVKISLVRRGKKKTIHFKIGALPRHGDEQVAARSQPTEALPNRLSITVVNTAGAVEVAKVERGGVGASMGLQPGMVITMIGNQGTDSVDKFDQIVQNLPNNRLIPIRIIQNGMASFLAFKLSQ